MAQKPNDKFACVVSVMLKLKYMHILTPNWYKKGISWKSKNGI